jgi:hypothetical protein
MMSEQQTSDEQASEKFAPVGLNAAAESLSGSATVLSNPGQRMRTCQLVRLAPPQL